MILPIRAFRIKDIFILHILKKNLTWKQIYEVPEVVLFTV
jgi:hypothetical protein